MAACAQSIVVLKKVGSGGRLCVKVANVVEDFAILGTLQSVHTSISNVGLRSESGQVKTRMEEALSLAVAIEAKEKTAGSCETRNEYLC